MSTTAIYVRQSEDKSGHAAAITRQESDCRELAHLKRWEDPVLYSDNSISATSGKTRPAFEKLLADVERGAVSQIVTWHLDRLTRSMKDLSRLIEIGKQHRVNIACVHGGSLDLGDPTGIALSQILTAISSMETSHKGERQRRANRQRAEAGEAFWSRRPFGYDRTPDGVVFTVHKEAEAIRDAAKLVLDGATLSSVVRKWNAAGFTTTAPGKGKWGVTQLRRLLLSPRYAGKNLYNGEEMGPGQWEPILDTETSSQLEELLTAPGRRTAPDKIIAKYLLSGIAQCGKCGGQMYAAPVNGPRGTKRMVYRCFAGYCMQRSMADLDEYVEAAIVGLLGRPDAAKMFSMPEDVGALRKRLTELRDRREQLAVLLAEGLLTAASVREQSGKLSREIGELEAALSAADAVNPVAGIIGAPDVGEAWADLPIWTKRAIVRALITVTVMPAGKGRDFDPDQVVIGFV